MEEKRMYNEDGSFRPLQGISGNVSDELADFRNIYMEAEKEYFETLLSDEKLRDYFESLIDEHGEELIKTAKKLHSMIEFGELESKEEVEMMKQSTPSEREKYHMHKLEEAEGLMCLLLAAARDKVKIKTLIMVMKQRESKGRSH